jgi:hypothetical protein
LLLCLGLLGGCNNALSKCKFTCWSSNLGWGSGDDWCCGGYWSSDFFSWGSRSGLLITLSSHFL